MIVYYFIYNTQVHRNYINVYPSSREILANTENL